jgi:DNA-binding winged helix-turn-helix (wHTH) protein
MSREISCLSYAFGPFRLDGRQHLLMCDGEVVPLPPKAFETLLVLVHSGGRLVEKTELVRALWPDTFVNENNLNLNIHIVRRALSNAHSEFEYIETVPKRGFRFVGKVRELSDENAELDKPNGTEIKPEERGEMMVRSDSHQLLKPTWFITSSSRISSQLRLPFGGHLWHALAASILYSSLFAIAVLQEVAYEFDRYGAAGVKVALVVFCWTFVTSLAGLAVDWKLTFQGSEKGLTISITIFLIATIVLFAGVRLFLPSSPITQASFQTYTAQAAYLKSITYFLILTLLFLITPFHFVIVTQQELRAGRRKFILGLLTNDKLSIAPRGSVYPRLWILTLLLMALATIALALRAHLFDNLTPSPHMNLFMHLVEIQSILYFALGIECLAWYYRALTELKRECLAVLADQEYPA